VHPFWVSILLGVVEGVTEFLPISSTGHLILTSWLIGFEERGASTFQIFIQLGAILAVVWEYRARLAQVARDLPRRRQARSFVILLGLAFLPSGLLALVAYRFITTHLFYPESVAGALLAGAVLIFVVEWMPLREADELESVTWKQALWIGLAQCLSLWPGFSRSAATILGGLVVGLSRRAATQFSFYLAIPTMFAATLYDLYKNYATLDPAQWSWLALAFAVSFVVAWASIRWLLHFVATHTFRIFAWYRVFLALAIFLALR
jgi:undecaprenyl-diphosphatase